MKEERIITCKHCKKKNKSDLVDIAPKFCGYCGNRLEKEEKKLSIDEILGVKTYKDENGNTTWFVPMKKF